MKKGIALQSIIPMRKLASEESEMTSQLVFGEVFEIISNNQSWTKIRTQFDDYIGFVDSKCIYTLSTAEYNNLQTQKRYITTNQVNELIDKSNNSKIILSPGSYIYNIDNKCSTLLDNIYELPNINYKPDNEIYNRQQIVDTAIQFLNTPYLWGGKSSFGIDCSGFTQLVYKVGGYQIPRDANQQANIGNTVKNLDDIVPGDLLFFKNQDDRITHVGIFIGNKRIIHASGKVRIDNIDSEGIYNDNGIYSHTLQQINSIIN